MIKLLHLSWEVPDCFNNKKTKAVKNLIGETAEHFQSYSLSFNRVNRPLSFCLCSTGKNHTAIKYFGFPYGLFHMAILWNLFRRIKHKIYEFDLLHGHKLTFEGVLCYWAYKKRGIPYVLTLRGNTDFKLIRFLPQYRLIFKKIAESAEKIFCLNPWSAEKLKKLFPETSQKIVILPNICHIEKFQNIEMAMCPKECCSLVLVTTFNLDSYKLKRFQLTLRILNKLYMPASLLVIGSGSPMAEMSVKKLAWGYSLQEKVKFLGFKNHEEMKKIYQKCDLFLLPSRSDTFGMAYLEALACGVPVLQSAGIGLDGYFADEPFFMTARSEDDFVAVIEKFFPKKSEVRKHLKEYIDSGNFEKFSVSNIVEKYTSEIYALKN